MFLSYSTTAIRQIRSIRGKTKKKHPENKCLSMFIALRINRKGFLLFLSYGSHRTSIRSIRPIRGRKEIKSKAVCPVII